MYETLKFFDYYVDLGWNIIPIKPNSKKPFWRAWNKQYDLSKARQFVEMCGKCNLGLLLGSVVDVEADTQAANERLHELTGGSDHPRYSSEKSVHHLFLSPDAQLTRLVVNGIEFRGQKHQSVIPPSININGVAYRWLTDVTDIPPMPDKLVSFYKSKSPRQLDVGLMEPWCPHCGKKTVVHKKRYRLETKAFQSMGMSWHCRKCRKIDVRERCRKVRNVFTAK